MGVTFMCYNDCINLTLKCLGINLWPGCSAACPFLQVSHCTQRIRKLSTGKRVQTSIPTARSQGGSEYLCAKFPYPFPTLWKGRNVGKRLTSPHPPTFFFFGEESKVHVCAVVKSCLSDTVQKSPSRFSSSFQAVFSPS